MPRGAGPSDGLSRFEGVARVVGVPASRGRRRSRDRTGIQLPLQDRRLARRRGVLGAGEEFWGETTPLHSHPGAEESFYVLEGRVELWAGGATSEAISGAFIVVPRGVPHALRRVSAEPVRMLTIVSPPGFEQIFRAVAEIGEESLLADPERLAALAAEYGTEVLGDYPDER